MKSDETAILGAGISGLALAFRCKERGVPFALFEKAPKVGGWIRSIREEGYFFECGPRSIRSADSEGFLYLIHKLGLQEKLLKAPREAFKRYLFTNNRLQPLPDSLFKALASPLLRPHLATIAKEPLIKRGDREDESVFSFFSRRFSPSFAEQFIDPMVRGIFAGDPKRLSIEAAFPKLKEAERAYGSLILASLFSKKEGKSELYTLEGGLSTLTAALYRHVEEHLALNASVTSLKKCAEGIELTVNGKEQNFQRVVSTLSAPDLGRVLPESKLKSALSSLPMASVAVVMVGYSKKVHPYQGFGYLVPAKEREKILGVVFDSSAFPFQNSRVEETRMSVMLDAEGKTEEECRSIALEALERHLGVKCTPDFTKVEIANNAIPHYPLGYVKWKERCLSVCREEFPGLSLLGTSFFGVSVNHSISHALNSELFKNGSSLQN